MVFSANPNPRRREYALFRGSELLLKMDFHLAGSASHVIISHDGQIINQKLTSRESRRSVQFFLLWAMSQAIIISEEDIELIGVKVAAPGRYFQTSRPLTEAYLNKLFASQNLAPAHISATIEDARNLLKAVPGKRIIAVSDSAFHEGARAMSGYALPKDEVKKYSLTKYGYGGNAAASVLKQLNSTAGRVYDRVIICDLGLESNITALHKGKSIYTSSGYSPSSGLPSVNGPGDVDPNALLAISTRRRFSPMQLQSYLNTASGLAGLSGTNGSFKKLFELSSQAHEASATTLKLFNEAVKKEIAAAAAMLNGLDMLVITGEDGLALPKLRTLVLSDMQFLGISLDTARNRKAEPRDFLNQRGKTGIALIEADVLGEIAWQVNKL